MDNPPDQIERCGYIAIVGRPNVGKSTLLNHLVEQKISITSRKPQTTRHNVRAIKTIGQSQMIFVDTPGMHKPKNTAINRYMNRVASSAVLDVDVVIFVVDRDVWTDEDEIVLQRLKNVSAPVILVINKVDRLDDKSKLIPHIERVSAFLDYAEIVPLSALRGQNLEALEKNICERLPEGMHFYPEDQVTDRSCRFMAAELVREKITRQLGEELPYQIAVEIEEFTEEDGVVHISALILVERDGQKRIIIGEKGKRLKSIGSEARKEMEDLFGAKVMLKLWVKVRAGWSDDDRALRSLGYDD